MAEFKSSMLDDHAKLMTDLNQFGQLAENYEKTQSEDLKKVINTMEVSLLAHLEEEEKSLEAENMKKYWTLEDINTFKFI
jgi:hemerythrin